MRRRRHRHGGCSTSFTRRTGDYRHGGVPSAGGRAPCERICTSRAEGTRCPPPQTCTAFPSCTSVRATVASKVVHHRQPLIPPPCPSLSPLAFPPPAFAELCILIIHSSRTPHSRSQDCCTAQRRTRSHSRLAAAPAHVAAAPTATAVRRRMLPAALAGRLAQRAAQQHTCSMLQQHATSAERRQISGCDGRKWRSAWDAGQRNERAWAVPRKGAGRFACRSFISPSAWREIRHLDVRLQAAMRRRVSIRRQHCADSACERSFRRRDHKACPRGHSTARGRENSRRQGSQE